MRPYLKTLIGPILILSTLNVFAKDRSPSEILAQTNKILITNARFFENAKEYYHSKFINQLQDEFINCGLSMSAPNCIDTEFMVSASDSIVNPKTIANLSVLRTNDGTSVLLVVEINKDENEKIINSIKIFKTKNDSKIETQKNDFQKGRLVQIGELDTPEEMLIFAKDKLIKTENHKIFYHSSIIVSDDVSYKNELASAIRENLDLFNADQTGVYQLKILELIRSIFTNNQDFKKDVSHQLMTSKHTETIQLASITLAEMGERDEHIKAGVIKSTNNSKWMTRLLAVKALDVIREGSKDENIILMKIVDNDSDVKETVKSIVKKFIITQDHLETLRNLGNNPSWEIRRFAINLMAKFETIESTNYIIGKLIDGDSDVKAEALTIINNRKLNQNHLAALLPLASHSSWETRRTSLNLISKIGGAEAKSIIMSKLLDSDSDVSTTAKSLMQKIPLNEKDIPFFRKMVNSSKWSDKVLALNYLGQINNLEAQNHFH